MHARRDAAALRGAFDALYEERFARNLGALPVEIVSWRVRVVAPPSVTEVRFADEDAGSGAPLIERRQAYFEELGGFVETPVYLRSRLRAGTIIEGPALVAEAESTAVVGPAATISVDEFGNLIMSLRHPAVAATKREEQRT
jgi:N-methylhydantoinase A